MTAQCATHFSGFSTFGTKTASTTPATINGESIYAATLTRVIPASCWDFGLGDPVTYVRFTQTPMPTEFLDSDLNPIAAEVLEHSQCPAAVERAPRRGIERQPFGD